MEGSSLSYKWPVEPPPWLDIWQHLNGTFEPNYQSHHILSTRLLRAVFAAKQALLVHDAPPCDWLEVAHLKEWWGEWCKACKSPSVDIMRIDFHWELQRCIFWPEWKDSRYFFISLQDLESKWWWWRLDWCRSFRFNGVFLKLWFTFQILFVPAG